MQINKLIEYFIRLCIPYLLELIKEPFIHYNYCQICEFAFQNSLSIFEIEYEKFDIMYLHYPCCVFYFYI